MASFKTPRVRYLSEADIAALGLSPGRMADAIGKAFADRAEGRVQIPPKVIIKQHDGAEFYAMTVSVADGMSAMKWVAGGSQAGSAANLPSFTGLIVLSDTASGQPLAILSASSITADRTAATSLLAARHLARAGAGTIGLAGCGAQARAHLRAFAAEYPLSTALLFGRGEANLRATEETAAELGLATIRCSEIEALLRGSDIVISSITPKSGSAPIIDAGLLPPGAFASMVDHGASWTIDGTRAFSALHTDDLAATRDRSVVEPHLREMPVGSDFTTTGGTFRRMAEDDRIGFVFAGTALADLAVCHAVLQAADQAGRGTLLEL